METHSPHVFGLLIQSTDSIFTKNFINRLMNFFITITLDLVDYYMHFIYRASLFHMLI